jgi:hypothetical protein
MARKRSSTTINKKKEKELKRMLRLSVLGIFGFILLAIIAFNFFGPQIGALFGFISIYRNDTGPQAQVSVTPPTFYDVPEATNERSINIKGYAPSGSTVKLYLNGPEKGETLAGGDGQFLFENITLIQGRNTIFAKTVDEQGNKSENSETKVIIMDDKKPDIKMEEPKEGDTIKNLDRRILVRGSVSEKAKVTVNDRLAVLKPDLNFEYLLGVKEGDVKITVKAVDEAGNERLETINVRYEEDSD